MNSIEDACNPRTSPVRLAVLAEDSDPGIRMAVSGNPNTPHAVLLKLARDPDPDIRFSLAALSENMDILEILSSDPLDEVRAAAASNPDITEKLESKLVRDQSAEVRVALAENSSSERTLTALAGDGDEEVREAVAGNCSTPENVLATLASDPCQLVAQTAKAQLNDEDGIELEFENEDEDEDEDEEDEDLSEDNPAEVEEFPQVSPEEAMAIDKKLAAFYARAGLSIEYRIQRSTSSKFLPQLCELSQKNGEPVSHAEVSFRANSPTKDLFEFDRLQASVSYFKKTITLSIHGETFHGTEARERLHRIYCPGWYCCKGRCTQGPIGGILEEIISDQYVDISETFDFDDTLLPDESGYDDEKYSRKYDDIVRRYFHSASDPRLVVDMFEQDYLDEIRECAEDCPLVDIEKSLELLRQAANTEFEIG